MSWMKKQQELQEEKNSENLTKFLQELQKLSVQFNLWIRPVIDYDGPKLTYVKLNEKDLRALADTTKTLEV